MYLNPYIHSYSANDYRVPYTWWMLYIFLLACIKLKHAFYNLSGYRYFLFHSKKTRTIKKLALNLVEKTGLKVIYVSVLGGVLDNLHWVEGTETNQKI